jgi:putative ABC transport system ATP-binding protein
VTAVPALRLEAVTKAYGEGEGVITAVDSVTLSVLPGEIVLVMGPSGSGKTTLLAMSGGLLRPTSGQVWLDEAELTALTERDLPSVRLHRVGFVFQTANLLANLTALENVEVVMRAAGSSAREARGRARQLLSELRLEHRLDLLPEQLSGGERQRVAIARALANDPQLILADEPTANLDSRTGYQLMHTLEVLAKEQGKSVVAVSHDHRIEDIADRVFWLEDGELADRPPGEAPLARDPVCGMTINVQRAAGERSVAGASYLFCSELCLDRFDAEPGRYIRTPPAS